jgi:hypothetical protein
MDEIKDPNGNEGNAGDGYKQTEDKQYLYGDGLKTKVWNPNHEGGGQTDGNQKGGYVDYEGDGIDFGSYGNDIISASNTSQTINNDKPSQKMIETAGKIRNTLFINIPGLSMPYINPFFGAEAIVFGGTGTIVGGEYGQGGFFVLAGKNKGSFYSFTEIAGGISSDIFAGISYGRVDYTGNSEYFTSQMLFGERLKGWIGFGEEFSGGVSLSKSIVRGGKVYTTELNLGFGASVIPFVGVGGNTGTIEP